MSLTTPDILVFGVDSLRADHLSCYGYRRLTSPRIDRLASQGALFENTYSPHIPTTSGITSMLSGLDVFSSQVVAPQHIGGTGPEVTMLLELLRGRGCDTTCAEFSGNLCSRGFDTDLDYRAWCNWDEAPLDTAQDLNRVACPRTRTPPRSGLTILHAVAAHGPPRTLHAAGPLSTHV